MTPAPRRWVARPAAPASFLAELPRDLHPIVGRLLWNRGIADADQADAFLNVGLGQLHDAGQLHDMDRAVARIRKALDESQRVAVYGDFDTDGVTGVVLLHQVLTGLGLEVVPYIPKRNSEGYGLNLAAVELLAAKAKLLITVDCGISNVVEIERAQALGLDVIVLDHHTPPAVLPHAYALINPKLSGCTYPYKMLAGVGVAYKLVQALWKAGLRHPFQGRDLLDMVALGTVSDMAPLDGENRVLVKFGIDAMNLQSVRPGLRALIEAAGVTGPIDCRKLGYTLGPRINSAGRIDDAVRAYQLLLCDDDEAARAMAVELNDLNTRRRGIQGEMEARAEELVRTSGKAAGRIIVLDGEDFPAGLVGLVAGRLVERFGRPVLLLERGEESCRGSARSVAGFSILDALTECGDLFVKYGGHAMAAGFTLHHERLPELEARLLAIAARDLTDEMLEPRLVYEAELPLGSQSFELLDQVRLLEPFGQGNPEPLWASFNLRVVEARTMGAQQQHLKLRVHDGAGQMGEVVAWNEGHRRPEFLGRAHVDIAFTLEVNEWQGRQRIQMKAKQVRLSQENS